MNIAVLGTGEVGRSIASGFVAADHDVTIAGRTASSTGATEWIADVEPGLRGSAHVGAFASAAADAEIVFLCVNGNVALDVSETIRPGVDGKILVDVTNPLTFPEGKPMELSVANSDSLGERVQRALPTVRVVKALNTVNSHIMTHSNELSSPDHILPIAGNDGEAKATVTHLLEEAFGWQHVVDLGDIAAARAMEAYLHLWLRLWNAVGHARFNIGVVV